VAEPVAGGEEEAVPGRHPVQQPVEIDAGFEGLAGRGQRRQRRQVRSAGVVAVAGRLAVLDADLAPGGQPPVAVVHEAALAERAEEPRRRLPDLVPVQKRQQRDGLQQVLAVRRRNAVMPQHAVKAGLEPGEERRQIVRRVEAGDAGGWFHGARQSLGNRLQRKDRAIATGSCSAAAFPARELYQDHRRAQGGAAGAWGARALGRRARDGPGPAVIPFFRKPGVPAAGLFKCFRRPALRPREVQSP
jgi:hypothetical protein